MIDTQSAPGAWAETLASPSCKIETTEHRPAVSDFNRDGGVNGPHAQDQGPQFASCVNAAQTSGCIRAANLAPVTNIQFNPQHSTGAG